MTTALSSANRPSRARRGVLGGRPGRLEASGLQLERGGALHRQAPDVVSLADVRQHHLARDGVGEGRGNRRLVYRMKTCSEHPNLYYTVLEAPKAYCKRLDVETSISRPREDLAQIPRRTLPRARLSVVGRACGPGAARARRGSSSRTRPAASSAARAWPRKKDGCRFDFKCFLGSLLTVVLHYKRSFLSYCDGHYGLCGKTWTIRRGKRGRICTARQSP